MKERFATNTITCNAVTAGPATAGRFVCISLTHSDSFFNPTFSCPVLGKVLEEASHSYSIYSFSHKNNKAIQEL
jgi:hypothetical protein